MTNDLLRQLCHLLGGLITIALAFLFYEAGEQRLMILYILGGIVLLGAAAASKWLVKTFGKASLLIFIAEALAFFFASRVQIEEDDKIVKLVLLLAAVLYLALAVYFLLARDSFTTHKKSRRKHRRRGSSSRSSDILPE